VDARFDGLGGVAHLLRQILEHRQHDLGTALDEAHEYLALQAQDVALRPGAQAGRARLAIQQRKLAHHVPRAEGAQQFFLPGPVPHRDLHLAVFDQVHGVALVAFAKDEETRREGLHVDGPAEVFQVRQRDVLKDLDPAQALSQGRQLLRRKRPGQLGGAHEHIKRVDQRGIEASDLSVERFLKRRIFAQEDAVHEQIHGRVEALADRLDLTSIGRDLVLPRLAQPGTGRAVQVVLQNADIRLDDEQAADLVDALSAKKVAQLAENALDGGAAQLLHGQPFAGGHAHIEPQRLGESPLFVG